MLQVRPGGVILGVDDPTWQGIIADLFPGVVLPEPDYTYLHRAVREVCAGAGLRANNYFMDKVQQVYETMRVRHGFMLIGNPIGGKTVALRTLAKALAIMNDRVSQAQILQNNYSFLYN